MKYGKPRKIRRQVAILSRDNLLEGAVRHAKDEELTSFTDRSAHSEIITVPTPRLLSVTESVALPPIQGMRHMPKNSPPPTCSKCGKPMHFMLVKSGGRKFRCIHCDGPDPLLLQEVMGELRRPE
jgi:hypothetical protein